MKKLIASALVASAAATAGLLACTGLAWQAGDGASFLGRTYDMFGDLSANKITVLAPGYELATSPDGEGETVIIEKGLIGNAIQGAASPIFTDAVNEDGLMGTLQNFPGYGHYDTNPDPEALDLHPAFFLPYILGTCSNLDEVEEAVKNLNLTDELIFGSHMSVHYILSDSTGEAIIIEPDEDGITVHRDTIGVMANSPDYQWQLSNLRNYMNVTNENPEPREFLNTVLEPFGNGTGGSLGLPGDYTSPSRFVRIAYAKEFAPIPANADDGVEKMFDLLSVVNVPEGMLKSGEGHYEKTLCTTVMKAQDPTYYFSPNGNRRISSYNLASALTKMEASNSTIALYDLPLSPDWNSVV